MSLSRSWQKQGGRTCECDPPKSLAGSGDPAEPGSQRMTGRNAGALPLGGQRLPPRFTGRRQGSLQVFSESSPTAQHGRRIKHRRGRRESRPRRQYIIRNRDSGESKPHFALPLESVARAGNPESRAGDWSPHLRCSSTGRGISAFDTRTQTQTLRRRVFLYNPLAPPGCFPFIHFLITTLCSTHRSL